jgi:uncharacterized protein (DUF1810 family)
MDDDPHRLQRFMDAQDRTGSFDAALAQLRAGRKSGHWIWYVFPQITGLGLSETSRYYAITSLEEAISYLAHPTLGPRLIACAQALTALPGHDARQILGPVDAMKLRSSMTLFARAAPHEPAFRAVLEQYFDGAADPATERRL